MAGIETTTGGLVYGTGDFYTYILNEMFLPMIADTVIYPNTLLKRLPRTSERVEGKNVIFPVHADDSNGVTALGADGLLPEPDTEKYTQYKFPLKHLYVRMKFDGITMDASRTQLASWLNAVKSEAEAKARILNRARQRMYHGDGSGRLAEVVSPTGGAYANVQYTFRINQEIENPSTCTTAPTRWLKAGQIVAFFTSGGTFKGTAKIASVDSTTLATLSDVTGTAGVVAAGDWCVTAGQLATLTAKDTGFKNEPMGLAGILQDDDPNDGTTGGFQGIDSTSTYPWHRANILSNSSALRPLTLKLMDQGWTTAIEIGDCVPTVLFGSFPLVRSYADLLIADRRFEGTRTFDGGYDAVPYNGVPFFADRDFYNNRIAMLDENDLRMYVMSDPQWMDFDGSIYQRLLDKDAYQATLYCREQLGCDTRDHHVLITDISEL